VGHASLSREGRSLAAVKACGAAAVLSHHSAAQLWDLLPRYSGPIHVTVPHTRKPHPGQGIAVHRSRTLTDSDIVRRNRIPVTTPARTLSDLKGALSREQWEAAVDRARGRGFPVTDLVDEAPTRSALERRFLRLCRRHRIRAPRVNVRVGPFLVDFLWEECRLIVEVDGYEFHSDRSSFEADRARDAELTVLGYQVLRFTYRQVTEEPDRIAATIRQMLGP
jgi:very-short-patch-repair endonuclease